MWDRLTCVTPGADAVSITEAKAQLRLDHGDQDMLIQGLIRTAQAMVEGPTGIGVALKPQTWRLSLDAWPAAITIPLGPVTAVTAITYVDADGATQTLAADAYHADLDRRPVRIRPAYGQCWPTARCQDGAIKVTFTAGAANPPQDLKHAMLLMIGHWYAHPEAVASADLAEMPLAVSTLLSRHRAGLVA